MGKVHCEACKKSCKGQAIRLQDKYFHLKCFKCKECKKQLAAGGFYTNDDQYYCQEDYQRLFGTRCNACQKYVEGEVVTALGNTYHITCFSCTKCNQTFSPGDKVTFNGKEYLCNTCLETVTSAATTPATGAPGSPSDTEGEKDHPGKRSPLRATAAPTTSTPAKHGDLVDGHMGSPMSEATTDFSMEMKENAPVYQNGTENPFRSFPNERDLLSPQSLTSGYKSDASSECRTLDRSIDVFFSDNELIPPFNNKENKGFESDSGSAHRAQKHNESGIHETGYDTGEDMLTTDAENTDKERLSPIQNIMQYRSPSPVSTHSRSSRKSRDSSGSFGSRFEVDYGKFYNTTYLEKYTEYKRGPPLNPNLKPKSPHYHRPENFSYSQVRKDFVRPLKKGMVDTLGEQYMVKKKTLDDLVPMANAEAIKMARFPDAHKPERPRPAPIDREDWPSPPDPAAAYPELLRSHPAGQRRRKSMEGQVDHAGQPISDQEDTENEVPLDPKTKKEMEHLQSISTESGAAMGILKDMERKRHEEPVLDPRSASRTPSASREPTYKTRYESPMFASPSRDLDYRPRLHSMDDNLSGVSIKKYRNTLPISNFPVHRQEWDYEQGKDFVRNYPVPKPGYGLASKASTLPVGRNGEYHFVSRRQDGTRTDDSTDELHRGYYSDFEGDISYDPISGLRQRAHRWRASSMSSDNFPTPYLGYRRSVPSIFKVEDPPKIYPYQQLKITNFKLPTDCDKNTLERHLSKEEFESIFHMTRPEFYRLAEWKRNDLKRRVQMF